MATTPSENSDQPESRHHRSHHALIEGRKIYLANGPKTQTVNVCSADNERGLYETTIRIPSPSLFVSPQDLDGIQSLVELEELLTKTRNARVEDFRTWSSEWKRARRQKNPEEIVRLWKQRKPKAWQRTDWSGAIGEYRHKAELHDSNRGEKAIESILFDQSRVLCIRESNRNPRLPFRALYHQLPLANQSTGQVIADALIGVEWRNGKRRPVMVEVKVDANDCWYALVECLQQVAMGRAYPDFRRFLEADETLEKGIWGMVLAPSEYFEKCRDAAVTRLLALLKGTDARIAFASTDRLVDYGEIELRPEQNWFI